MEVGLKGININSIKRFVFSLILVFVEISHGVAVANSIGIEDFLILVTEKHKGIHAARLAKMAAFDRQLSGDLSLVPTLTLRDSILSDKKQPNFYGATESKTNQLSALLGKKFSTGTQVQLSANSYYFENDGISSPAFSAYSKYAQGGFAISLSQSLWKDAFGKSIRLRRAREAYVYDSEKAANDLIERQLIINAENQFWDYIYLKEELKLRRASLERALRIEQWMKRRFADGISDRADLLSVQALVAQRRLQLQNSEDEWVTSENKIRETLELNMSENLPELQGDLNSARPLENSFRGKGRIQRLDAYLAEKELEVKRVVAEEVADSVSADLNFSASYSTNTYQPGLTHDDVLKNIGNRDTPSTNLSLSWTYLFDTEVKSAVKQSALRENQIAELRSQRKKIESENSWTELIRKNQELSKKIESALGISSLQTARAKAEQEKLNKGRSITSNVINSEQEAADAELTLTKLKAEQRKLEAQTRNYVFLAE